MEVLFLITRITNLKSAVHVIEKLYMKLKKLKLNQLLLKFFLGMIDCQKKKPLKFGQNLSDQIGYLTLSSNGNRISYKIDTGAQFNVIPVEILENVSSKPDL